MVEEEDLFKYAEKYGIPVTEEQVKEIEPKVKQSVKENVDLTGSRKELKKQLKQFRILRKENKSQIKKLKLENKELFNNIKQIKLKLKVKE